MSSAVDFLRDPPLHLPVKAGYRLLLDAAIATLPPRISGLTGLTTTPRREAVGGATVRSLRWALGSSPAWQLALVRAGAPIPAGVFRQPLPDQAKALIREGHHTARSAPPAASAARRPA